MPIVANITSVYCQILPQDGIGIHFRPVYWSRILGNVAPERVLARHGISQGWFQQQTWIRGLTYAHVVCQVVL